MHFILILEQYNKCKRQLFYFLSAGGRRILVLTDKFEFVIPKTLEVVPGKLSEAPEHRLTI